jgi:GTP-binding protein HflX
VFDRPDSGETAVLVSLALGRREEQQHLAEFQELAESAGVEVKDILTGARAVPEARYFIGVGKAEELREMVEQTCAEIVLVNHALSPAQQRNLERFVDRRVVDRTGVILDIFAQRARTHEGKLQVELAQLQHLSTRLVRGWTHLERQKGGIGLRGPGETQLESDRRIIGKRIRQLHERLDKVREQRGQGRRARRRANLPIVSLVGYTNAGKSTLFNRLTGADVFAEDQLFATLDTTLRRLELPQGPAAILSDTVGFIRELPHDLVAAFRATLEETLNADLLLMVVDASSDERRERAADVLAVLKEIGAADIPRVEVYNKCDALEDNPAPTVEKDEQGHTKRVWVSAASGEGLEVLAAEIARHFEDTRSRRWLRVTSAGGKTRAWLYQRGAVLNERTAENGDWLIEVSLGNTDLERLPKDVTILVDEAAADGLPQSGVLHRDRQLA